MKFSEYFFDTSVRVRAVLSGLMTGCLIGLLLESWQYGVLTGAIVTLLYSLILPVLLYRADLPYLRLKDTLPKPFLIDARVRFTVKDGSVGGFFILTDRTMIFLSAERGNHRLELSRSDVKSVIRNDDLTMSIFLNQTQFVRVMSATTEEILQTLRENGWSVSS
ncbi:MAG: hypothetical protein IIX80_00575 [Clostridia bacterium]|nr:hypothetical protein [Clostridia bacterium]